MSSGQSRWQQGLEEARAFHQANGHLRVRTDHVTESGFRLGQWIVTRRVEAKAGKLSDERVAALNEIGMVWDVFEDAWRHGLSEARAYSQAHGHLNVPQKFVADSGFALGQWIVCQRVDFKAGRLSHERIAALDELHIQWLPYDHAWHRGLDEARDFRRVYGHLMVRYDFVTGSGFKLGSWIGRCRKDLTAGRLAPERKAALDELGMVWRPLAQDWADGLEQACAYRQAHGHLRVPSDHITPSGFGLGTWIGLQRTEFNAGRLSPQRTAALDELGMVWNVLAQLWARGLEEMRAFRAAQGHARVPVRHVTQSGFRLGAWVVERRRDLRTGRLPADRKAQLDELGMVWDGRVD